MRKTLISSALVFLFGCQPAEEQPPQAEPEEVAAPTEDQSLDATLTDGDVYVVEFENEWVRIIRATSPPGHKTNRHTHRGGVYVTLEGSPGRSTFDDGEVAESEAPNPGDIGDTFAIAGLPHVSENLGDTPNTGVMVELKIEDGSPLDPPSQDAVVVDGDHHTVELENELVRVVRMHYPEGYSTPPHNHYPGVGIALNAVKATSSPDDDADDVVEQEAGAATWSDGGGEPHVTRNLGGDMHLIRVELKVR